MIMNTSKLIMLRIYSKTLGRVNFLAKALKKRLIRKLVLKNKEKYTATSKFFQFKDLK